MMLYIVRSARTKRLVGMIRKRMTVEGSNGRLMCAIIIGVGEEALLTIVRRVIAGVMKLRR